MRYKNHCAKLKDEADQEDERRKWRHHGQKDEITHIRADLPVSKNIGEKGESIKLRHPNDEGEPGKERPAREGWKTGTIPSKENGASSLCPAQRFHRRLVGHPVAGVVGAHVVLVIIYSTMGLLLGVRLVLLRRLALVLRLGAVVEVVAREHRWVQ